MAIRKVAHLINQSPIVSCPEPVGVSGVQDLKGGHAKGQVPIGAPGRLHGNKVLLDSLLVPAVAHDNIHEAACSALTALCVISAGWRGGLQPALSCSYWHPRLLSIQPQSDVGGQR